ncbi:DUF4855 domain-containing protein [Actinopolymorpha singaporensis]|uniref:DUF4855 domain-containing protein n=1 Tax=Actinopolymorpha singaporensis TaxID=117157 RepID=UPI001F51DBE5|nr:DUF4855 domain-containing protein [Actinopolymorpha singaporensis]
MVIVALAAGGQSVPAAAAAQRPEPRNLAAGRGYTWSQAPDAAYPDSGMELTDGRYGRLDRSDQAWVGHTRGKTREVVIDLGGRKSVSRVTAHFMQDWPTSSILVPLTVSMYVSNDGASWAKLGDRATQLLWGDGPPRDETYSWDGAADGFPDHNLKGTMAYARFVKVTFSVHTRASQLLDEVQVLGFDGRTEQAVTPQPDHPAYLKPGPDTAGISDLALLYNGYYPGGRGDWTKDRIIPYLEYVNTSGNPEGRLFDGILYLGLRSPNGRDFGTGETKLPDWNWYLEKTFATEGDLQQLNEASKKVADDLSRPDLRTKVVLMIPNPGELQTDFGDVDDDGVSENVNESSVGREQAVENREKIVRWWIDALRSRWAKAGYSHLKLSGLYWLDEQVSTSASGPETLRHVSAAVHDNGFKLFWIPHFLAYKSYMWSDVGIDAAAFQPNYFFEEMDPLRIDDASGIARRYGMGVEVEFDERMLTDDVFRNRYITYLNGGVEHGYMRNAFLAYYQGNDAVLQAARSGDPRQRILYDWLHDFVRGTYKPQTTN